MRQVLRHLTFAACFSALLLAGTPPLAAQGETGNVCVRDYTSGAVCTANDVRIEALNVVSVAEDCASGTPGETEVVFETLVSSDGSPDRYDIGLYLALDGGSARDGDSCYHDYLEPPLTATPTYGDKNMDMIDDITDGPWWNGNTDGDTCGDIESNTQLFKTLPSLRFACIDTNGDGSADVSVCTSWDNNTGTACNAVTDAFPGTNSKCSCAGVELGIAPSPEITIVKSPASQMVASGLTASFTFTVTSKTTVSNVMVSDNPACDTLLGPAGDTNNDTILTPDETWTYTCDVDNVTASFMDTVTVTGDGPLGAVMDTDTASVTVSAAQVPVIGLAKSVTSVTDVGGGLFDVAFQFVVENLGNVPLDTVQVTDDLTATFPAPVTFSIQAGPSATGALTANAGFNGNADQSLLNAMASSLAVGASETVTLTVRINPNGAPGPFSNTATADGEAIDIGTPSDVSDNGTDPDPNGNGDPTEAGENDPTPIAIPENPVIGVAKAVTTVSDVGGGQFDVGLLFTVENLGNVPLSNVQVTDDLTATFPMPVTFAIPSGPAATGTLTANAGFNGNGDQNLLNSAASSLAVGASATIMLTVRVTPNGEPGPFDNSAIASGDSPLSTTVNDTSDNGFDPDPNGNGNPDEPGENDPTPISPPPNPVIGVAKSATSVTDVGGGQFDVALQFVVENLGNVALSNVQVTDNLTATFPAPVTFVVQAGPAAGGTLTANAGFDGNADQNLLNDAASTLAVGASATITLTVRIAPNGAPGPFSNTASAFGEVVDVGSSMDTSDNGTDPDPDGDGNPDEPGENDPTPIAIVENPVIGVAKSATSVTDAGGGQFDVALHFVVENLGNVALSNVLVTDDLTATFPAPVTFVIQSGPAATGTLTANASFNGSGDQNLLNGAASSLAIGASATIDVTVRITPNGAPGPFSNTATASGTSPGDATVNDTSDDGTDPDSNSNNNPDEPGENDPTPIVLPGVAAPAISLIKSGVFNDESGDGSAQVGETIGYSFDVTNTGNVDLVSVAVTDPMVAPITCPGGNPIPLLAQGAMVTCTGSYTLVQADVDAGLKVNTATASGMTQPGAPVSDNDTVTVVLPLSVLEIPTLSEWALAMLVLLLTGAGVLFVRRR